jgi:hypothetical protein
MRGVPQSKAPAPRPNPQLLRCILCGGGNGQVKQLLANAGGTAAICDACANLAVNAHKDIAESELDPAAWQRSVEERARAAREGLPPMLAIDEPPPVSVEIRGEVLKPAPEPSFYSCTDDVGGQLTDTDLNEAIENFLDHIHPELPETVEVYGWRRVPVKASDTLAAQLVERVLEDLDEQYGDPDGDNTEINDVMRDAGWACVDAIVAEYQRTSWPHEIDKDFKMEVNTREWMKEHAPEWFAALPPNDETEGQV